MRPPPALLWLCALAACGRGGTPRARVLAELPGDATLVAVATGAALSDPALAAAWAYGRTRVPPSFACAWALAPRADEVGLAIGPRGAALVLATGDAGACPELVSVGGGLVAVRALPAGADDAGGVLDTARFARAAEYLRAARAALVVEDSERGAHLIAVAQDPPIGTWVAIDGPPGAAPPADALRRALGDAAAVTRTGGQVVARLRAMTTPMAAHAVTAVAAALAPAGPTLELPCPPHGLVDRCAADGWRVESLRMVLDLLARAATEPVIDEGAVTGYRLTLDVSPLGLVRGDELVAIGKRPIASPAQITAPVKVRTTLEIRRRGTVFAVDLIEE